MHIKEYYFQYKETVLARLLIQSVKGNMELKLMINPNMHYIRLLLATNGSITKQV